MTAQQQTAKEVIAQINLLFRAKFGDINLEKPISLLS